MNRGAWWATDPGVTKSQTGVFSGGEYFLFHFFNTLFFGKIIYLKCVLEIHFHKNVSKIIKITSSVLTCTADI